MRIFIFALLFIADTIRWDIILRFKNFLNRKKAYLFLNKFIKEMASKTFIKLTKYTGIIFKIEKKDTLKLPEKFIAVTNHQSLMDIPVVIHSIPNHDLKFVAKKSLSKNIPLISQCIRIGKHARISRHGGFATTKKELDIMAKLSKSDGICPLIFPEGTRSKTGKLGKFHNAAIRYLCKVTDLPIVSIAIDGGYILSRLHNFFNITTKKFYKIKLLSVHKNSKDKAEIQNIMENIKSEIDLQLQTWRSGD